MEFHSPRVEKIGEKYYWVAGQSEVHHLNHHKSEEANYYSMKLSKEEIEELPVVIIYTGFDHYSYSNDEEKAFAILLEGRVAQRQRHELHRQEHSGLRGGGGGDHSSRGGRGCG